MENDMIATHFENLDRQLARVGQILPTLATQNGLENLDRRLARVEQILPTLATQVGLDELRTHMNVLNEAVRSDIQLLAEHLASDRPKSRKE